MDKFLIGSPNSKGASADQCSYMFGPFRYAPPSFSMFFSFHILYIIFI